MLWRPRSLRIRYTLRALLVFITLFMLWGGYHANRGWKERQAIPVLVEGYASLHEPRWPWFSPRGWYRKLVWRLWRDRCVTTVSMNAELSPEEVEALASLPSLFYLILSPELRKGPDIPRFEDIRPVALPPGALRRILSTHAIRCLSLDGCLLSEDDLRAIGEEETLTSLTFMGCTLSDDHLSTILSLPRLQSFQLGRSPVSGEGLANHPGSQSLTTIWSAEVPLGEEFAAFMAKCPNLRSANLADAKTSVEFTRHLENHPSLEELGLAQGGLSEASIDSLLTIPRLTRLALPIVLLTPEVEARIKKQRPNWVVMRTNL